MAARTARLPLRIRLLLVENHRWLPNPRATSTAPPPTTRGGSYHGMLARHSALLSYRGNNLHKVQHG